MSSLVRLFELLSQSQWYTDHPVPTGKTPEEVLKKYLQKVRHPPDEVSAGEAGQGSPSSSPTSISSSRVFAPYPKSCFLSPDRSRTGQMHSHLGSEL